MPPGGIVPLIEMKTSRLAAEHKIVGTENKTFAHQSFGGSTERCQFPSLILSLIPGPLNCVCRTKKYN